jgi:hypothetical protein
MALQPLPANGVRRGELFLRVHNFFVALQPEASEAARRTRICTVEAKARLQVGSKLKL